jgi:hypothetical protein
MTSDVVLTGWSVGFCIAFAIILVVVVLVAAILGLAQRIAHQNRDVAVTLARIRANTSAMPQVEAINAETRTMSLALAAMREVLEPRRQP